MLKFTRKKKKNRTEMATTDSGGETGYESNDSTNTSPVLNVPPPTPPPPPPPPPPTTKSTMMMTMESTPAKSDSEHNNQQVPHSYPQVPRFNFSTLTQDVLKPGLAFLGVLPLSEHDFGSFSTEDDDFRCKMRRRHCALRRSVRFDCLYPLRITKIKDILNERKLILAANLNNVEAVRKLLEMGVDPKSADKRQRTALHFAACKGYVDIVRILLEHGADPNQKDAIGNTPLHLAACTNHVKVITLLLQTGANPQSMDNSGRSPLQLAQSKLKLLQMDRSCSSRDLKDEVLQIIQMLHTYLQKSGLEVEAELLSAFSTRLTLSQSKEEADDNVRDLLSKLSNMSLKSSDTGLNSPV